MGQLEEKTVDLAFKVYDSFNNGVYGLVNLLVETFRWTSSVNADAKILKEHIDAGAEVDVTFCESNHLNFVECELRNEGIPFMSGQVPCRTESGEKVFRGIIASRDCDAPKMKEIVAKVRKDLERGGVKPRSIIERTSEGRPRSLSNIGIAEAMLFEKFSKGKGINIAIEEPSKDERKIIFAYQDQKEMRQIAKDVATTLSGPAGRALQKQLLYDHQSFQRISETVCNYEKGKEPFYVVGTKGKDLYVDEQKITVLDPKTKEPQYVIPRDDKHFQYFADLVLSRMEHPVPVSKEQFQKLQEAPDRESYIADLRKIDRELGRPGFTKEELQDFAQRKQAQTIKEAEAKKESLYEQKLSFDNPEQEIYQYSYLNDEMNIPDFKTMENINRNAVHDKTEGKETPCPEFEDDAAARYRGYNEAEELLNEWQMKYQEAVLDGVPIEDIEEQQEYDIDEREEREF